MMNEQKEKTILIVDDEEDFISLVLSALKSEGYKLICANDGVDALEKYNMYNPDLVLLDLRLPFLDGFQLLEKINDPGKPVFILTTSNDRCDMEKAFSLGAWDYIVKPFKTSDLKTKIIQALEL